MTKKTVANFENLKKEWHHTLNEGALPEDFSYGSRKKVWWRCKNGHNWDCIIKDRTANRYPKSCPICKSLAFLRPDLCAEFDRKKNLDLDPKFITANSSKKVHWSCSVCQHSYLATVNNRNHSGSGCPACSGRVVTERNSVSNHSPHLIAEWSEKNIKAIDEFSFGSDFKALWVCSTCDYEWRASISKRTISGRGCRNCGGKVVNDSNRFSLLRPNLLKEIHPTKNNNFNPDEVSYGSNKKIWWICERGHEWYANITNRSRGAGCPHCSPHTSRAELRIYAELTAIFGHVQNRKKFDGIEIDIFIPDLKLGVEYDGSYWHQGKQKKDKSKNAKLEKLGIKIIRVREAPLKKIGENDITCGDGDITIDEMKDLVRSIISSSADNLLFTQLKTYLTSDNFIDDDYYKNLLSYLPGPEPKKSLKQLAPDVCKKWDYDKNAPLSPEMFHQFSMKVVHWVCEANKNHTWEASIASQNHHGCPYCASKKFLIEDSFGGQFAEVVKEFIHERNLDLDPFAVAPNSNFKAWWECKVCSHKWETTFGVRARGFGCPKCGKRSAGSKMGKKVHCPDLDEYYDSINDAERILVKRGYKAKRGNISQVCNGYKKTHLGLSFKFVN